MNIYLTKYQNEIIDQIKALIGIKKTANLIIEKKDKTIILLFIQTIKYIYKFVIISNVVEEWKEICKQFSDLKIATNISLHNIDINIDIILLDKHKDFPIYNNCKNIIIIIDNYDISDDNYNPNVLFIYFISNHYKDNIDNIIINDIDKLIFKHTTLTKYTLDYMDLNNYIINNKQQQINILQKFIEKYEKQIQCLICYDNTYFTQVLLTCCSKIVCQECIEQYNKTCPFCRTINPEKIIYVNEDIEFIINLYNSKNIIIFSKSKDLITKIYDKTRLIYITLLLEDLLSSNKIYIVKDPKLLPLVRISHIILDKNCDIDLSNYKDDLYYSIYI